MDPCLSVSVVDLLCNLFVEHADVGASREVRAVEVTLADQSFGGLGQVGDHVGDMAAGDVVFGGVGEDATELSFTGAAGGGRRKAGKSLLRHPCERGPVSSPEVSESPMWRFGEVRGKGPSQSDEHWEVIRVQSGQS